MSENKFKSTLGAYMIGFIEQKRNLGYKAATLEAVLKGIDHYLADTGFAGSYISQKVYDDWWQSTEGLQESTRYARATTFIRFIKYLTSLGIDCYVPRYPRKFESYRIPYTFSEEEMDKIFKACDNLRIRARHTKSVMIAIPALIRLLYSTAVRISEALDIRMGCIDFKRHTITLNKTKNGCQRYAPINNSLEAVLRQYISYRNKLPYPELQSPVSHLFVSSCGKPIAKLTALKYMHRVVRDAGMVHKGNGQGPHLHNIRHSACVHSMLKCARNGMDLYSCLPILSVFMGHKKVWETEEYLRLTQEMYPELVKLDRAETASINSIIRQANITYDEKSK